MSAHSDLDQTAGGDTLSIRWLRAARCAAGNCVEIGLVRASDVVLIRDSKDVEAGAIECTLNEFRALMAAIKAGTFDRPR